MASILFTALALLVLVVSAVVFLAVVKHTPRSDLSTPVAQGDFEQALRTASGNTPLAEADLVPAAVAARHLASHPAELDAARNWLETAVERDPTSGEAWLELGLTAAYRGDSKAALEALAQATRLAPELTEALTLHRAWTLLRAGDRATALKLFEEIEASLETKLETDLGAGEPVFADWFFQAAELWRAAGRTERAAWAYSEGLASAPQSRLGHTVFPPVPTGTSS